MTQPPSITGINGYDPVSAGGSAVYRLISGCTASWRDLSLSGGR
jgi:hypothetical protein